MIFNEWFAETDPDDSRIVYVWYVTFLEFKNGHAAVGFSFYFDDSQNNPDSIDFSVYVEDVEKEINMPKRAIKLVKKLGTKKKYE